MLKFITRKGNVKYIDCYKRLSKINKIESMVELIDGSTIIGTYEHISEEEAKNIELKRLALKEKEKAENEQNIKAIEDWFELIL